jgi:hypothetical protein
MDVSALSSATTSQLANTGTAIGFSVLSKVQHAQSAAVAELFKSIGIGSNINAVA